MRLVYMLTITVPDEDQVGRELMAAILESAEPHDYYWHQRVRRWLGGSISEARDGINDRLPDGWEAEMVDR